MNEKPVPGALRDIKNWKNVSVSMGMRYKDLPYLGFRNSRHGCILKQNENDIY